VTQKALQTVVIGQQAENLLNFDDPTSDEQQPSGIAATAALAATPAAANLLSGTSSNPLDDLVSIFGSAGIASTPQAPQNNLNLGGLPFGQQMSASPAPTTPSIIQAPVTAQPQQVQDDLLGLF
jgi:AP-1 complex subunit beta-1